MSNLPASVVPDRFLDLVAQITARIASDAIDPSLEAKLNADFPADGGWFVEMARLCDQGRSEGWLCAREQGGIRFGRPVKAGPATHGFSVDVVEMADIVGPHHRHPNGEIDMIMPQDATARFDGGHRGWKVYGPDSAHEPTVTGGKATILYLLPEGAIDFGRA